LDTNIPENRPEDQDISDELYGGDIETRIQQEMLLGIGGLRALRAVGFRPYVFHMNEGHSAFLALEHIRLLMEEHGLTFAEAREVAVAGNIFTTHTPVPAGIDVFPVELVDRYLGHYYAALGISREEFLALGRARPEDPQAPFNMAILAIHLSGQVNAVSRLHSTVARQMWQGVWPEVPEEEVPITWVTNGIHVRSWISRDMAELYDRYLGPRWREEPADQTVWEGVTEIPDEELWRTHERRRERMVAFARRRLRDQLAQRGASPAEIALASEVLSPEALTIGFARRFAAYKRATLIFQDLERLTRLLTDRERPVQIIFAGKAHPRDDEGKALIRQVVQYASREELRHHIVFLEDHDMNVARYLVQGADLWLNTPRRFLEACGTSGMKAAANGVLNISILDGWWDEAYRPEIGWAIGRGEVYEDYAYQDQVESQALYNLLEKAVIPLFYERGSDGLPRGWIAKMKASMRALCPTFNTNRMVQEYNERFYQPAIRRYHRLMENDLARARTLARWKARVRQHWPEVRVEDATADAIHEVKVGDHLTVRARVRLGSLSPDDVSVQVYYGPINAEGEIGQGKVATLALEAGRPQPDDEGWYTFIGTVSCTSSGQHGYALRVLPHHEDLVTPYEPGLIVWSP
ncbi:MAG: alpha-glucan family phosphorylase, partial [Chloroflexi bacterium]